MEFDWLKLESIPLVTKLELFLRFQEKKGENRKKPFGQIDNLLTFLNQNLQN